MTQYPDAYREDKVGTYPAKVYAGGGYVWDEVLEYRVWCHPENGAEDLEDGSDYYYAFARYADAKAFAESCLGAEDPVALILQREYISEPEEGHYIHVKEERMTEWPPAFLARPRRTADTIPAFFAPDAPADRLDILRGTVRK